MPELSPHAPDNPDFARVIAVRALRDSESFDFDIAPTPAEAEALARLLDARAVRKMRFRGRLTPLGRGWQLEGELGATVVQSCVVTLDPVTTRIDQPVRRRFVPAGADVRPAARPEAAAARPVEIVIDPAEDEEVEPLLDRIDLGLVATEALALALPAYPRKPGATLEAGQGADDEAEPLRPFAALEALRGKLGDES